MIKISEEQEMILESDDDYININAFAGTGKTTTLLHYTLKNKNKKFLYLCYNRKIKEYAEKIFPSNVTTSTIHSLAYKHVGFRYKNNLVSFLTPEMILSTLNIKVNNPVLFFKIISGTLDKFCNSADDDFNETHLPLDIICMAYPKTKLEFVKKKTIEYAHQLFSLMINSYKNPNIKITHDVYLKIFHLFLDKFDLQFDNILLDEAQDANNLVIDIIKRFESRKIFVGDKHQCIYGFRGAANALDNKFKNYYLTKSFRFGKQIANVANMLLGLNGETNDIVGTGNTQVLRKDFIQKNKIIISRNNYSVLDKLFSRSIYKYNYYVEGGVESYGFIEIEELFKIFKKEKSNYYLFKYFENFNEIEEHAENNEDKQLSLKCNIVKNIENKEKLNYIKSKIKNKENEADIILSNTHKIKGKEYNIVELDSDFSRTPLDNSFINTVLGNDAKEIFIKTPQEYIEELNIAYVAITRAKEKLYLDDSYYEKILELQKVYENPSHYIIDNELKVIIENKNLNKLIKNNKNNKEIKKL